MSQKTLNLCLERYNFVKFGETTKSTHTVLCTNNAHSVNSDKYRLTPTAIASKHGEGYVFTLNYDFDRPLFTIVQKSYSIDGTSGKILFEGIDPISKDGSKYLRRVEVSPVKLSDSSYLLEVTKDEYLRIGTTGAALGDEGLESLNEKIVTMGGIEKSVETVGGKQVLKLDGSGTSGKEIVYFDVDPSDPPSGIYEAIGEALSNNKLPAIRSDGKLYQYTSTDTDRYDFVGMFGHSDVGYEALTVWIGDAVNVDKLDASLGYTAVPASGTDESPAWAKVCELDLKALNGYTTYGLALLFTSENNNDEGENVESGLFVADISSHRTRNSNSCNASWMAYTPNSDEYSKILGIKLIGKYGVPSNPVLAPYPIYKVEVWVKYYGSNEILVNALQNARYNYSYGMNQGIYKFPEGHIATPQSTEPSYSDTEEYVYKNFFYTAESPSVSYTHVQSLTDSEKVIARDNISAASASDVAALQSQVSSLSDVSAYTVKGEATVAQLNAGPSGIQAGWAYQLTDSGTLTNGTLAVAAGDTVAWDGTKWFPLVKSDYYATKTYVQNVAASIAPEFVPNETEAKEGKLYVYGGAAYKANVDYYGVWDAGKFHQISLEEYIDFVLGASENSATSSTAATNIAIEVKSGYYVDVSVTTKAEHESDDTWTIYGFYDNDDSHYVQLGLIAINSTVRIEASRDFIKFRLYRSGNNYEVTGSVKVVGLKSYIDEQAVEVRNVEYSISAPTKSVTNSTPSTEIAINVKKDYDFEVTITTQAEHGNDDTWGIYGYYDASNYDSLGYIAINTTKKIKALKDYVSIKVYRTGLSYSITANVRVIGIQQEIDDIDRRIAYTGINILVLGDSYSSDTSRWRKECLKHLPVGSSITSLAVSNATVKDRYRDRTTYPYTSRPVQSENSGNLNTFGCQIAKLARLMEGTDLDSGEVQLYPNGTYPDVIIVAGGQNDNYDGNTSTYVQQYVEQKTNVYYKVKSTSAVTRGRCYAKSNIETIDRTNFAGAYRYICESLKKLFPKSVLMITTRSNLCYWESTNIVDKAHNISEQQKWCAAACGVPVIDWQACQISVLTTYPGGSGTAEDPYILSGNGETYSDSNDGMHPNIAGGEKLGAFMANEIWNNFVNK